MNSTNLKAFRLVVGAVLATGLGIASAQVQNTNTTIQEGRVCINRTSQYGDSNDNSTYQGCKVNINRTTQAGGNSMNQTGQFGRLNHNRTSQRRSPERTGSLPRALRSEQAEAQWSKRGRDHGRGDSNHGD